MALGPKHLVSKGLRTVLGLRGILPKPVELTARGPDLLFFPSSSLLLMSKDLGKGEEAIEVPCPVWPTTSLSSVLMRHKQAYNLPGSAP